MNSSRSITDNSFIKTLTGQHMPLLGLGTWELTDNTADIVSYAINNGYRLFDTSSDYGSQPGIAEGIIKSKINRDALFISSKVEEDDDALARVLANLKELRLEYLNLTLIHRPPENNAGEKLWIDLIKARKDGYTKDIGVSNYSIANIKTLIDRTNVVPSVNQIEWSPFGYSQEMIDYCHDNGIIIQAYSPLTRGDKLNNPTITALADKHNVSAAQVLIRWNIQLGSVPLPKSSTKTHLLENIKVFDFQLDFDDMTKLMALNEHYSSLAELPMYES